MSVIVADIGASNARFAVLQNGKMSDIYQFACDDFNTPEAMIAAFKNMYAPKAAALIVGVAGIVLHKKVSWTNRSWQLTENRLKKNLGFKKVILKNDVEVQCMAVPRLKAKDYYVLQKGQTMPGPKVLLSLGTGVGAAYYLNQMSFAMEYGQTLTEKGSPLEKMLAHLPAKMDSVFAQKHKRQGDTSCQKFYQNLAYIVNNLVLTLKSSEGIYLYGRMLDVPTLKRVRFIQQFLEHPTMGSFLKTVPIYVIKRDNLAFVVFKELAKKYDLS